MEPHGKIKKINSSCSKNNMGTPEPQRIPALNADCLVNIFKYLSIKDKISAERVSKLWNSSSRLSWNNFTHLSFDQNILGIKNKFYTLPIKEKTVILKSIVKRCGMFLKSIDFIKFNNDQLCMSEVTNKENLKYILKQCPELKVIEISSQAVKRSVLTRLDLIIKKLRRLKIFIDDEKDKIKISEENLSNLFTQSNQLEYLSIDFGQKTYSGDFLKSLPNDSMKGLVLTFKNFISLEKICQICQQFENLQELDIQADMDVGNFPRIKLPKTLLVLKLENTCIRDLSSIYSMSLLKTLSFKCEYFVSDSTLNSIATNISNLKKLHLESINISDEGLKALRQLPLLEELSLTNVPNVTGKSLKYFSSLKVLKCLCCADMRKEGLCRLLQNNGEILELWIAEMDDKDVPMSVLEAAVQSVKTRTHETPIIVKLRNCNTRITPIINKTSGVRFEIDVLGGTYMMIGLKECFKTFFIFDEERDFLNQVASHHTSGKYKVY